MDIWGILQALATPLVGIASIFIVRAIKTPTDAERAQLLARIARDAAALIVSKNANAPWSHLLTEVMRQMRSVTGVPTSSASAIERAASGALTEVMAKTAAGRTLEIAQAMGAIPPSLPLGSKNGK